MENLNSIRGILLRRLFLVACFLCMCLTSSAQYKVKGRFNFIPTKYSAQLRNARITVRDLGDGYINPDKDWKFTIELPKGRHTIEISADGFKTLVIEVHDPIEGDVEGDVILARSNKRKEVSRWLPYNTDFFWDSNAYLYSIDGLKIPLRQVNTPAQFYSLACKYYYVERYKEAINHLEKAAKDNLPKAQYLLGTMYYEGKGTIKNERLAKEWLEKAAANGNNDAKAFLAGSHTTQDANQDMIQPSAISSAIPAILPSMEKRIALVIGNGDYQNTSLSLLNPTNDALDLIKKLKLLGFDIFSLPKTSTTNQDLQTMDRTVKAFCQQASQYDVALFFYSGHAVQYQGENYLVPVNVKDIDDEDDVKYECFNVNRLMEKLTKSGVKTKIIILDACRNNPFSNSRGVMPQGLAAMSGSEGSYLAFSAQAGKRAQDGKGQRNSPYTAALLKMLDVPGLNLPDLFEQVKELVLQSTNNQQWPSEINNMRGRFYFNLNVKR